MYFLHRHRYVLFQINSNDDYGLKSTKTAIQDDLVDYFGFTRPISDKIIEEFYL
jgi:RNase P/RNase MRP subunit POP5